MAYRNALRPGSGQSNGCGSPRTEEDGVPARQTRSMTRLGGARSPSPSSRVQLHEVDQRSIVQLSQTTTDDLDKRLREKSALTKMLQDLKKKKLQYDAKIAKKQREVDTTVVQTLDMNKKLEMVNSSNRITSSELTGLRQENERMEAEVSKLRDIYKEACESYERECFEVEKTKQLLQNYRKEIGSEGKQRDNLQSDLRASRTAQTLMINRLDEMEKRHRALKSCVVEAFNS
eukprot:TRINITY_DN48887_c0_g1_i1.p1 TRINITY_DN48887_c0_g1~~TRINITY_DN48887_c0_g1_i1.p1  ORF type:complete len:257 (-),score=70.18 TRINITY_DN48887_c0_g1_i1:253-948(-)